ncbi:MAG: CzcE family metal-binding protein, partial [Burkholderiaceae bacterium]
ITIAADTPWANVREGESIRFVAGQSEFGWKFDGTRSAIDLMRIAPAGVLARPVTVYVAPTANGRRSN